VNQNGCNMTHGFPESYLLHFEVASGPISITYICKRKCDMTDFTFRVITKKYKKVLDDRRIDTTETCRFPMKMVAHPNILKCYDAFEAEGVFGTVSEYCPGGTMEDFVLEPSNSYTNASLHRFCARLGALFRQIMGACQYLHEQIECVHGNIKLTNIFFKDTKRTHALLGDLEAMKMIKMIRDATKPPNGKYVGTCLYVAPEVIAGGNVSPKSDIYAVGACVYIALDKSGPFEGMSGRYVDLVESAVEKDPTVRLLNFNEPTIPIPVQEFLDKSVDGSPEKRMSARELLTTTWLTGELDEGASQIVDADDATRLLVTSDEGRDLDWELSKVILVSLMRRVRRVRLIGCVVGLAPAEKRARLCKGTLVELGMESVPVAMGDERVVGHELHISPHELEVPYLAREESLYKGNGVALCEEMLSRSPDKTVTFMMQSGPTDIWKCLEALPNLFMRKVARVIVRSEVQAASGELCLSEDGAILPEVTTASSTDREHMQRLFRALQDLGVPMTVVTRFASYAAKLPFAVYDTLGRTHHPVGQRLMKAQERAIQFLWDRCLMPPGDPMRKGLPDRCDKVWFSKLFLGGGKGLTKGKGDSIWDLCTEVAAFSAVQMVAGVPELKKEFFVPKEVTVIDKWGRGVVHEILGLTEAEHGVAKPAELSAYLSRAFLTGLTGTDRVQQNLLIISDDGKDLDDELAKVLLRSMMHRDIASCSAFIATLHPAPLRARLSKGTCKALGMDVPVGIGSGMGTMEANTYEFDVEYLARNDEIETDGKKLFVEQMRKADDGLFTLVVLAGMRDAWDLLRDNTELFRRKISRVVIMGGIEVEGNSIKRSEEGYLVPDTAANNVFDKESASNFYRELQRQVIPTTVVSRWAAYAAKLPLSIYDRMGETGHPVGVRLQKAQKHSLEHLWNRACLPAGDPGREGLPARCDQAWFSNVFLGGKGKDRKGTDSIWDLAGTFQAYDAIALLAALPSVRDRYLDPMVYSVKGLPQYGSTEHEVMGLNPSLTGVRDPDALRNWLEEAVLDGITPQTVTNYKPTAGPGPSNFFKHVRGFAQQYASSAPTADPMQLSIMKLLVGTL